MWRQDVLRPAPESAARLARPRRANLGLRARTGNSPHRNESSSTIPKPPRDRRTVDCGLHPAAQVLAVARTYLLLTAGPPPSYARPPHSYAPAPGSAMRKHPPCAPAQRTARTGTKRPAPARNGPRRCCRPHPRHDQRAATKKDVSPCTLEQPQCSPLLAPLLIPTSRLARPNQDHLLPSRAPAPGSATRKTPPCAPAPASPTPLPHGRRATPKNDQGSHPGAAPVLAVARACLSQ